jgi:hypothetical protein
VPATQCSLLDGFLLLFFFWPLGHGGSVPGGRLAVRRRGAAVRGLLRLHVPRRVRHREAGADRGAQDGRAHLRQPDPAPLPRLLRPGLRRLSAPGRRSRGDQLREGRAAEQRLREGVPGGRRGQGSAGGVVPWRRLLRRHPCPDRRDIRRAGTYAYWME